MEQYKLINAQLMNQVQSQRKMIGQMREEEVLLKKQWMEEHERRLADAQYNEIKLKFAIRTLLNNLDINMDLNNSTSTTQTTEKVHSNSNRICSEFRRSSVLLQRSVPISPVSRKSSVSVRVESSKELSHSTSEEQQTLVVTPQPRHLDELLDYTSSPHSAVASEVAEEEEETGEAEEEEAAASPVLPAGIVCGLMYSIIEESDSDITAGSSINDSPQSKQQQSSPLPLRDVTNKSARQIASPKQPKTKSNFTLLTQNDAENEETTIVQVRTRGKKPTRRGKSADSEALESLLTQNDTENEKTTIVQVRTRGKKPTRLGKSADSEALETSIEPVRHAAPPQSSPMPHLTVPSSQCSVNVVADLSPRRSQLNFERFNGIICRPQDCSTPQQQPREMISNAECSQHLSHESTLMSTSSISRPSRNCRPKSLKEPSSKCKMRRQ